MEVGAQIKKYRSSMGISQEELAEKVYVSRQFLIGKREFPIVKDTTPNMMNPRLYTTSYNKPQGQQFDTAVLSFL